MFRLGDSDATTYLIVNSDELGYFMKCASPCKLGVRTLYELEVQVLLYRIL